MSRIASILLTLKRDLSIHGATIDDVVNDYDKQRTGYLTYDQLQRGLSNYDVRISYQDLQDLAVQVSDGGRISVRKLLDAVRSVRPSDATRPVRSGCEDALIDISRELAFRQVTLSELLAPFDKQRSGVVSSADFAAAVGQRLGDAISREYADRRTGAIRYAQVERDLGIVAAKEARTRRGPPHFVTAVVSQIATAGSNLRSAFEANDRLGCGHVTPQQFIAALTRCGASLAHPEMNEVVEFYRDGRMVNYLPILEEVEGVRREQEATRNEMMMARTGAVINTTDVLVKVKATFERRKVDVPALFAPIMNRDGYARRYAFAKLLEQSGLDLSNDEVNAVAARFDAGDGLVDAESFVGLFRRGPRVAPQGIDPDPIGERVHDYLARRRMCLRSMVERIDRMNTGEILHTHLLTCLQQCGVTFKDGEFEALAHKYEIDRGVIDWRRLCRDIDCDEYYTRPQAEPEPVKRPTTPKTREMVPPPTGQLKILVAKMGEMVRKASIKIEDDFRAADRKGQGYVTYTDLAKEIASISNCFTVRDMRVVYDHYVNYNHEFDYLSFCRDLQDLDQELAGQPAQEDEITLKAIRHYRAYLIQRRLDADSIFRRFDPNSTGYIPVSSLGPAFGSSWFQMTKPEMDALIAAFADKVIKDRFWYRKLDQRAAQEQIEPAEMRELLNPSFAEEERDRELGSTLCEIKEKFRMRKKNPEALFAGLDGPTVSYNEFRNRLEDAGIILRWAQEQVLLWRYNGKFGFDWRQFCHDCEASCLIGEPH